MGLFVFQSERAETRDERAKDETVALNRCAATPTGTAPRLRTMGHVVGLTPYWVRLKNREISK